MLALIKVIWEIALWAFIFRVFVDFFPPLQANTVGKAIMRISEPVLLPIRRVFRPMSVGDAVIDLSAVVVVLVLYYLRALIL